MARVYILTGYNDLEGSTTVLGVYSSGDEASKMAQRCQELADADCNIYSEFDVEYYEVLDQADLMNVPGDLGDDDSE